MAELREIIKHNDFIGEVLSYHTGNLSASKIDTALMANGYVVPLPNKVSFSLYKMAGSQATAVWLVTWIPLMGKYATEKLTLV
ncbi:MAG: hypothetical protein DRH37_07430 [Deltaproteobacteria bacterium]|nr:MAG: hypothetical protein DRH37_07430 [Deltaproteobacteria bacterium]